MTETMTMSKIQAVDTGMEHGPVELWDPKPLKRTDIHRPSVINPDEYEFVAFENMKCEGDILGWCMAVSDERARIKAHMARTGGTYSHHEHGGNCMICGAHCVWTALFYHEPTNVYIRTGLDCANKLEMGYGDADFNRFKKSVEHALEAQAGKRKAKAILEQEGLGKCWELYVAPASSLYAYEETTIIDIVGKLVKYGSINEKQIGLVKRLMNEIEHRAERKAKIEAERAAAPDVPKGRMTLTGKVVKTRVDDTIYGSVVKMLFVSDEGFRLWGTCPDSIASGDRPKPFRITLTATVEPSKDDPKFGFFKRPIAKYID